MVVLRRGHLQVLTRQPDYKTRIPLNEARDQGDIGELQGVAKRWRARLKSL